MNFKMIKYVIGWLLIIVSILMIIPIICAIICGEDTIISFLIAGIITASLGTLLRLKKPENMTMYSKEGLILVAIGWILISLFSSLPFIISGAIKSPVDAIFETVSGLTTTGSSILTEIESLPKSILLWRSFTHWIGGMGILVFVLAIVPLSGGSNMNIMKAESPGPQVGKLRPKVQSTAKRLYIMYMAMTFTEIIVLLIMRMPIFDAICISFGTAGTGGFGIRNDSCASYTSLQQVTIAVFMLLFGVNFNVYSLIWGKKIKEAIKSEELRNYFTIILIAVIAIFIDIMGRYKNPLFGLRDAFFTVSSIITTTGFGTADFDLWPEFAKAIIVTIMFVGACAGSTGGGIKVSRIVIMLKTVVKEVHSFLYPKNIEKIRYEGKVVEHNVLRSINVFLMTYILVFILSFFIVSINDFSFEGNFSAVTAALNNIGPGLAEVGPTKNFSEYSDVSKIVLIIDMLAGRLELFPIIMLFLPKSWKKF
ncbi:MAG: TrkH family potassium uptake protein [Lachnospiraceae bacterium]|nr:TrkH family potassium uptake protein [Lachnospiraceae bacterium]